MHTQTYRGSVEVYNAVTGTRSGTARVVLEPRIDGRPGCWGIVHGHDMATVPPHMRLVFAEGGDVLVLVDWQDAADTARVRGGSLPAHLLGAVAS